MTRKKHNERQCADSMDGTGNHSKKDSTEGKRIKALKRTRRETKSEKQRARE